MSDRSMRARLLLLAAATASATACGSTVAIGPAAESAPNGLASPSGPVGVTGGEGDGGSSAGASSGTSSVAAGSRLATTSGSAAPAGRPAAAAASPLAGPGVTPTTIAVGLVDINNTGANYATLGARNISTGDLRRQQTAMLNHVNAHGGVAGRRLVPVWFEMSAASYQTASQQQQQHQAMCAAFTEDHKVFAVIFPADDILASCLGARGVTMITAAINSQSGRFYDRFPAVINIANLNLDRMARVWIPELSRVGYFKGWDTRLQQPSATPAKLGIVVLDQAEYVTALRTTLLPTLARYGFRDPTVYRVDAGDLGQQSAAVSSAALRFQSDGVDHVLFLESNGFLMFSFANAAYGQRYFPRYGVTSQDALGYFVSSGNVPAQTAVGAVGIGWIPTLDLPWRSPEATNAARRRCDAIMKADGQTATNSNNELNLLKYCDSFFFLQAAARRLRSPNQAGLRGAVDRMAGSFASGYTISTYFSAGRHDGAASYRPIAFQSSCQCFAYTGSARDSR